MPARLERIAPAARPRRTEAIIVELARRSGRKRGGIRVTIQSRRARVIRFVDHHPVIEDALEAWRPALGTERVSYGGHAYRVFNFTRFFLDSDRLDDTIAVASAFHDIGIWTDKTFDYLPPSIARARDYLQEHVPGVDAKLVADVIDNHHRVLRVKGGPDAAVVEAFRQADLADVTRGLVRGTLDLGFVREAEAAFPYAGFQQMLLRTALSWFLRHPLRPLPMMRL